MGLREKFWQAIIRAMGKPITPAIVQDAALKQLVPLGQFLRDAGVGTSSYHRWRNGAKLSPLTIEKLRRAVERVYGETQ